jgi:hypothetical protein
MKFFEIMEKMAAVECMELLDAKVGIDLKNISKAAAEACYDSQQWALWSL